MKWVLERVLSYDFISKAIRERNPRQAPCLKGCGTILTVYSKFEQEYEAICPTCKLNQEKSEWQEMQQEYKHKSEVNPLITYCHDINNIAEWWEVPFELKKKRENERYNSPKQTADS